MRLLLFMAVMLGATGSFAATITASTGARNDVQTALNSAVDGDTVIVPDGAYNWTSGVFITNKVVTLRAATPRGVTLTNNLSSGYLITFGNQTNKLLIIDGFVFRENATTVGDGDIKSAYAQTDQQHSFWIRGCYWPNRTNLSKAIHLVGRSYGLISSNWFSCPRSTDGNLQHISVEGDSFDFVPNQIAGTSWTQAPTMGTVSNTVIEYNVFDNAITQDSAVEGYSGARITFRFNAVTNDLLGAHGNDSSTRSTYSMEIYGNTWAFTNEGTEPSGIFDQRGGVSIVCSNDIYLGFLGSVSTNMQVMSYRSTYDNVFASFASGRLGITNIYDGCSNSTGWPGIDQIGRVGPTVFNATNSSQPPFPSWQWSNVVHRTDGSAHLMRFVLNPNLNFDDSGWPGGLKNQTNHIIEGRDFTNNAILSTAIWQPLGAHPLVSDVAGVLGGGLVVSGRVTISGRATLQ